MKEIKRAVPTLITQPLLPTITWDKYDYLIIDNPTSNQLWDDYHNYKSVAHSRGNQIFDFDISSWLEKTFKAEVCTTNLQNGFIFIECIDNSFKDKFLNSPTLFIKGFKISFFFKWNSNFDFSKVSPIFVY